MLLGCKRKKGREKGRREEVIKRYWQSMDLPHLSKAGFYNHGQWNRHTAGWLSRHLLCQGGTHISNVSCPYCLTWRSPFLNSRGLFVPIRTFLGLLFSNSCFAHVEPTSRPEAQWHFLHPLCLVGGIEWNTAVCSDWAQLCWQDDGFLWSRANKTLTQRVRAVPELEGTGAEDQ